MTVRPAAFGFFALVTLAAAAPTAAADGLPVPLELDTGPQGVAAPDGELRYLALAAGGGTVVAQVEQDGGRARESRFLPGEFTVPAVALDGSTRGLSADGSTLVLIRPRVRFPQPETNLLVLDAERLRERERLTLDGDFSFDAISPDGSVLYLIEYVSRDPTDYRLRAYDLPERRLRPDPILDPGESPGEMRGFPITRATGADGRWEYTLYDGGGKRAFIHALDTLEGTSVCIDLDHLEGEPAFRLGLELSEDGETVSVVERGEPVATVDAATLEVTDPTAPEQTSESASGSAGPSWPLIGFAGAGLILFVGSTLRRRRSPGQ